MAGVAFSAGQNTSDHKTGSPTCTISGGLMTFSVAQTSDYLVFGDEVTYDSTKKAYLWSKVSDTQWWVRTATGGNPSNEGSAVTVNSIAHCYTSINAAIAGASDANHVNNTDITAAGANLDGGLWITGCRDSGDDTTRVAINKWTTDSTHKVYIYIPWDTRSECNKNQRFGADMSGGYKIVPSANGTIYGVSDDYIITEGLHLDDCNVDGNGVGHYHAYDCTGTILKNSIIHGQTLVGGPYWPNMISIFKNSVNTSGDLENVVVYDGAAANTKGISTNYANGVVNASRCVVYGMASSGIDAGATTPADLTAKNCISFNNGGNDYNNTGNFNAASDYNLSGDGTEVGTNSGQLSNETVTNFFNSGTDFHINPTATNASDVIGAGTDESLPDIDERTIQDTSNVDCGASQYHWGQSGRKLNTINARTLIAKINSVNTEKLEKVNGVSY